MKVKTLTTYLMMMLAFATASAHAETRTLTFDTPLESIPDIQDWNGISHIGSDAPYDSYFHGYPYAYGNPGYLTFSSPVVFNSVDYNPWGIDGFYLLYNGDNLVYQSSITPSSSYSNTPYVFTESAYSGPVTRIVFSGSSDGFAIDNLSYSTIAAVPEPETYAMLIAGLGLLGIARRRKQARS